MLKFHAIFAITVRHIRLLKRDINLALATFYWPLLDVLVWGFLGAYIQTQATHMHNYTTIALLGILLWQTTGRGAIVLASTFVEELWSYNLLNLVSLPLSLNCWILGVILYNILTTTLTFFYCIGLIYILYGISALIFLKKFLLFAPPLFISGLALGFICLQIIAYCGKRAQELCFVFAWFFAPFSTAFYPREVLPHWAQMISDCLPMSHVFTGMRILMIDNGNPTPYIIKGYLMAIGYLCVAIIGFAWALHKSRKYGLARLSD
jgi:ABC-2 type transport system permease protein